MFRNSPEGSYFDGSDSMEQLKEEQARLLMRQMSELLLRQNVRTAGRTFHTARAQQLPLQSPTIAQPTQPMDVEEEMPNQTPTVPTSSTQQASQLNAELQQRENTATKRKEETTMNHRGEVFKQNKPRRVGLSKGTSPNLCPARETTTNTNTKTINGIATTCFFNSN